MRAATHDGLGQGGDQGPDVPGGHTRVVEFDDGGGQQPAGLVQFADIGCGVDSGAYQQRVAHFDRGQVHGTQNADGLCVFVMDDEVMNARLDHLHEGRRESRGAGHGVDGRAHDDVHGSFDADVGGGYLAPEVAVSNDAGALTCPDEGAGLIGTGHRLSHLPHWRRSVAPDDRSHVPGYQGLRACEQSAAGEALLSDHGSEVAELERGRIVNDLPRIGQAIAQRVLGRACRQGGCEPGEHRNMAERVTGS
jgi:hypothetical protein